MDSISMGEGSHKAMKEGGQGAALPHDAGGGGVPRAAAVVAAARAPRCSSPPSAPLSPSPIPPIMQWFILPHTSVPSYVNMVFDAIIFIL
jgi:hypothetical protein